MSLAPIVKPLSQALGGIDVRFAPDCIGRLAHAVVDAMPDGGIALLENLRFHAGEEKGDPAFADQLATLGRHLRQRRVLGLAPCPRLGHRPRRAAACLCRPADAGRAGGAGGGPGRLPAADRGADRRRQGVEQARRAGPRAGPGRRADHRRRHGQHLPQRARRSTSASRCASTISPRRRARSWPRPTSKNVTIVLPTDVVVAKEFKAGPRRGPSRSPQWRWTT